MNRLLLSAIAHRPDMMYFSDLTQCQSNSGR